MASDLFHLLPFAASCASGLSSAYLLAGLTRLPPTRRARLLARQLTHLAAADFVYAAVQIPFWILNTGVAAGWTLEGVPDALRTPFCGAAMFFSKIGDEASLLFECHLALTFAASIYKSSRALRALSRCLPFAWLLAIILAIVAPVLARPVWGVSEGTSCGTYLRDWVSLMSVNTVFLVCLISYVVSTWYVLVAAGAAVQESVGARARLYLLAAVLASGPLALYNELPQDFFHHDERWGDRWFPMAVTLYNFNGLFHYAIYVLQCRRAHKLRAESPDVELSFHEDERDHSFRVAFRDHASVQEISGSNTTESTLRPQGPLMIGDSELANYFGTSWNDVSWFVDDAAPQAFYRSAGSLRQSTGTDASGGREQTGGIV